MLDIDDFKQINDNYGHITGDKILIFVASLLKKTLRDSDKIFRYGGEEFIIILNRNEDEEARLVADRILKLIRNNRLIYLGETINITASIGLTRLLKSDKTQEDLLQRADKALYKSKSDGKNRLSEVYE
jgi:diguanylate cyclase (GGDEF)-like protein